MRFAHAWFLVLALLAWTAPLPAAQKTTSKTGTQTASKTDLKKANKKSAKTTARKTAKAKPAPTPLPEIKPSAPPAGTIAAGTRFATPYFLKETGVPGPRVVILGGVHGDESSGALSAGLIEHWPITRGTLMVIPRSNVPGLAAHTRNIPDAEQGLENLNRNFPRAHRKEPARGEAAIAIWERIGDFKPDWVLDLHEGFAIHKQNKNSVGSSVIATTDTTCLAEANRLLETVNATIPDSQKHFELLRIPVDGSLAGAAGEHLGASAMIIETTMAQPIELRTRQHRTIVRRFLSDLKMIDGNVKIE